MLALKPNSRFQLEDDILLQALPELDHYYVFKTKEGDNFKLNHTAHWVFEAIGKGMNYSKLLQGFSRKFKLDKKTAEKDLTEVIKYGLENKIIKEVKHEKGKN